MKHPSFRPLFVGALLLSAVGLATFLWRDGRWRWASDEQLLARAESRPGDATAQAALGYRLRLRGQDVAAAEAFGRALQIRPADLEARRALARTLLALGREDAALLQMREIVKRDPHDAEAQAHLGEYYLAHNALSWAVEAFERVVEAQPGEAGAWYRLGEIYLALHQTDRAAKAFETAGKLAPENGEYRVGLARAYLETGQTGAAETLLRREVEGPAGAQAAYWLGTLYARSPAQAQARQQALHWLEQAYRKDPNAPGPLLALGKLMLQGRQPKRAIVLLEGAIERMGDDPEPLYYLARAYRENGRSAEARACLRKFAALTSYQQKRQGLAFRLMQTPGDPALRRQLADLEAGRGTEDRTDRAVTGPQAAGRTSTDGRPLPSSENMPQP